TGEFGWHADRHARRHWRDRTRRIELGPQRVWLLPEQQGDRLDLLRLLLLQRRQLCRRRPQLRGGVGDVEVRTEASRGPFAGELHTLLLHLHVLVRDVDLPLHAAQLDVVAGDLGERGQERVAPRLGGG